MPPFVSRSCLHIRTRWVVMQNKCLIRFSPLAYGLHFANVEIVRGGTIGLSLNEPPRAGQPPYAYSQARGDWAVP